MKTEQLITYLIYPEATVVEAMQKIDANTKGILFVTDKNRKLVGVITDAALENPALLSMAEQLSLQPEQFGMKLGMIIGMLFPLIAIAVYATYLKLYKKKN